jgi:hypothetical protein
VVDETVHLNLADNEIDGMGWQQPPRTADDLQSAGERDADREI